MQTKDETPYETRLVLLYALPRSCLEFGSHGGLP